MIKDRKAIRAGAVVSDPIGRKHTVADVFVPKNDDTKRARLPASFRNIGRKVVVFEGGGIMHCTDIQRRYSLAS